MKSNGRDVGLTDSEADGYQIELHIPQMVLKTNNRPANSPTPDDGSSLLNLPFDQYERYTITQVIAAIVRSVLKRKRLVMIVVEL